MFREIDVDGLEIVSKGYTGRRGNLLSGTVLQERLAIGRVSVTRVRRMKQSAV